MKAVVLRSGGSVRRPRTLSRGFAMRIRFPKEPRLAAKRLDRLVSQAAEVKPQADLAIEFNQFIGLFDEQQIFGALSVFRVALNPDVPAVALRGEDLCQPASVVC